MPPLPGRLHVWLLAFVLLVPGCASPAPVMFRLTDGAGEPVVGAHVRVVLLDGGAPLPLSAAALEEVAMQQTTGGGFSDDSGRVALPVTGNRSHLIEMEGPALGGGPGLGVGEEPMAIWIYRPSDGAVIAQGEPDQPYRLERVE